MIYRNWCGKLKIRNWWINKIETTPVDSSKLRDVLKTEVIKKILYDELRLRLIRLKLEKIKSVDTNLEQTASNWADDRVILIFDKSIYAQNSFSLLHRNFILNFNIIHGSKNWPRNPTINFPLKFFFVTAKLVRNAIKSQFAFNGWRIAFDGEGPSSFSNEFFADVIILLYW